LVTFAARPRGSEEAPEDRTRRDQRPWDEDEGEEAWKGRREEAKRALVVAAAAVVAVVKRSKPVEAARPCVGAYRDGWNTARGCFVPLAWARMACRHAFRRGSSDAAACSARADISMSRGGRRREKGKEKGWGGERG